MCNIKLLLLMVFFVPKISSAQFYTITKECDLTHESHKRIEEPTVIKVDTLIANFESDSISENFLKSKKSSFETLNDQKSHIYTLPQVAVKGDRSTLPELTIPNLISEINKNGIKYPKIVLAQAILETGWFKSSVCRSKHNLFGLTNPRTGQYYEFNHWTESVKAYYTKVQYRYKEGNYLLWLRDIGYAEDKGYIRAIIRILGNLDNRFDYQIITSK